MASARARKWTDFLSCSQVLNIMVILGFMFNYMLRVNLTIAIVAMIDRNATNTTHHLHPPQATTFAWSETQKNDILGSFFWGYLLTELAGGRLAEVVGGRRIFGGGMLLAALLTVLTPAACRAGFHVVLVLRALLGFFLGATWPAILPLAARWVPPLQRSKFIAHMMASSLGAALTMPACGYLIATLGWEAVFYVTGGIGVAWSVGWFVFVFDSPAQHPRISAEERDEIEGKLADGKGGAKPTSVPWIAILTSGPVWAIIITHACSVFCYFTVVNQLPSYMDQVLNFNIKKNGLLSSLPYLAKYVMAVMASYFADRLRQSGRLSTTATRKIFTTFAVLTPGLLMAVQACFGRDPTVSVVVFTTSLFFNGAVTAGYLGNGLDIAPNFSGTIFGMANTLSSFGGWLSTKIVALLTAGQQTFEQWQFVFWILVGMYVLGAFVYLVFGTGELQAWNSVQTEEKLMEGDKEMQPLKIEKIEKEAV